MKRIITILVVLGLFLLPATAVAQGWDSGDSWSYKWTYDFHEQKDEIESTMKESSNGEVSLTIDKMYGGYVAMYTIEYVGTDDGYERFDYSGGYYSEIYMDISMETEMDGDSMSADMEMNVNKLENEFSGSLWVEEEEYGSSYIYKGESYSVVKQTIDTSGSMDMEMSMEYEGSYQDQSMDGSMEMEAETSWDLDMDINYDPALPWLPPSSGNMDDLPSNVNVGADYTGSLSGDVDMTADGTGDFSMLDQSIEKSVSESLNEQEDLYVSMHSSEGDMVKKPSPVMGCMGLGGSAVITEAQSSSSYYSSNILGSTIGKQTKAEYDETEGFYTTQYMGWFGSTSAVSSGSTYLPMDGSSSEASVPSESTTEDEVNDFESNKSGYYSDNITQMPIWASMGMMFWILIIVIIGVVLAVVGLLAWRKKSGGPPQPPQQGPYGQQTQQPPQQQQQQQPPQQQGYQESPPPPPEEQQTSEEETSDYDW